MRNSSCIFAGHLRPIRDQIRVEFSRLLSRELHDGIDITAELRVVMDSLLWVERLAADHESIFQCQCWQRSEGQK